MNNRILVPVLFVISLICIIYAIYRSIALRITINENGKQVIYGEPQHGLILGLCIFAGMCVLGAVALLLKESNNVVVKEQPVLGRRTNP